jgi:hypothetical protein
MVTAFFPGACWSKVTVSLPVDLGLLWDMFVASYPPDLLRPWCSDEVCSHLISCP